MKRSYSESDLWFEFEEKEIWLPEKEKFYQKMSGIKVCDFVWNTLDKKGNPNFWIIEVKTSAPRNKAI